MHSMSGLFTFQSRRRRRRRSRKKRRRMRRKRGRKRRRREGCGYELAGAILLRGPFQS